MFSSGFCTGHRINNSFPKVLAPDTAHPAPDPGYVLVIDQTLGDASVAATDRLCEELLATDELSAMMLDSAMVVQRGVYPLLLLPNGPSKFDLRAWALLTLSLLLDAGPGKVLRSDGIGGAGVLEFVSVVVSDLIVVERNVRRRTPRAIARLQLAPELHAALSDDGPDGEARVERRAVRELQHHELIGLHLGHAHFHVRGGSNVVLVDPGDEVAATHGGEEAVPVHRCLLKACFCSSRSANVFSTTRV